MELPTQFPYCEDEIIYATEIAQERLDNGLLIHREVFDCLSITHTSIETGVIKIDPKEDELIIRGLSKIFKR